MIKLNIVVEEPQQDGDVHVSQLHEVVDNSVDHLIVDNTIDYCPDREKVFKLLLSKLRLEGIIEISGIDIFAFAKSINHATVSMPTINDILYKGMRQSVGSLISTVDILKQAGLDVQIKHLNDDNFNYYVKAVRCNRK